MASKKPAVGMTVVVHDRGRPQAGRDVHPAIITMVNSEADGNIAVRVLPENGVDYPIKAITYLHGKAFVEGLAWRWPEDSSTREDEMGSVKTPQPQATPTPTPGNHEPRNVSGGPVAAPGNAPNEALGERSDTGGEGSLAAQATGEDPADATDASKIAEKDAAAAAALQADKDAAAKDAAAKGAAVKK